MAALVNMAGLIYGVGNWYGVGNPASRYSRARGTHWRDTGRMPVMRKLEIPDASPEGPLARKLEPYLWLDAIVPCQTIGRGEQLHWLEVCGIVKPYLTVGRGGEVVQAEIAPMPEPADLEESYIRAHNARESLLNWAQTAIIAAESAGYRHLRHPEINLTGDVHAHYKKPWKPDLLVCEVKVRLWLTRA